MDAMVVQIESCGYRGPFERCGPRTCRDIVTDIEEWNRSCALPYQHGVPAEASHEIIVGGSRCLCDRFRCVSPRRTGMETASGKPASPSAFTAGEPVSSASDNDSERQSVFVFSRSTSSYGLAFSFASHAGGAESQTFKRRRPATDVDGPNTASLGCKKRRLRKQLITSKLSRPFSLPATYKLNRESASSGKQFPTMSAISTVWQWHNAAATPSSSRHHQSHPSSSTLLRRAAAINCYMRRARTGAALSSSRDEPRSGVGESGTMLHQQRHILGLVAGTPLSLGPATLPSRPTTSDLRNHPHASPPSFLGSTRDGRAQLLNKTPLLQQDMPPGRDQMTLPSSDAAVAIFSSRTTPTGVETDLDENGEAFPASADDDNPPESSDDPDDIYADFGLIFAPDASDGQSGHYEDIMDDLDGIPWMAR
ncbi:hypothetical protein VTK73DRAFT_8800 [Phialemonium thermophilum]|uniref:Uncharacterized protein n=1 Tax=Phialemonium thermophilum TaxID=223376 RepID=A0ABR3W6H1_9PEZI